MQNPESRKESAPPVAESAASPTAPPVTVAELERRLALWLPKLDDARPATIFQLRREKNDGR
jgi:hypothetical protein